MWTHLEGAFFSALGVSSVPSLDLPAAPAFTLGTSQTLSTIPILVLASVYGILG